MRDRSEGERAGARDGGAASDKDGRGAVVNAAQDEMEFLSVGLDKQPQFRSHDRNQPKRRPTQRTFATVSPFPFVPPPSYFRNSPSPSFRLECNSSRTILRALSSVISLLLLRSIRPLSLFLFASLFSPLASSSIVDPVAVEK